MKSTTFPLICGLALAAMSAAGLSHWWSVRQFEVVIHSGLPAMAEKTKPSEIAKPSPVAEPIARKSPEHLPVPAGAASQKEFYEALLAEMKTLRTENRNLLDQMGETNRNVMNLEFRVDTHSDSFRPLPVAEERFEANFDDGSGVLPPRAEPVFPGNE